MEELIYAVLGFVIGAGAMWFYMHNRTDSAFSHMEDRFKVTAQEAVQNAHNSFIQMAEERFKQTQNDHSHDLDKRQKAIKDMVEPMHKNLQDLSKVVEQVKGTDKELREDMKLLNKETARLVGALRDPAAQGKWGEFILEGLLDNSGLIKGVHYETQVSINTENGRQQPDAVIRMQDGFNIVIDSKAPINEFTQRLSENLSQEESDAITQKLARQVREHAKALGAKGYWENIDSPDFVVMFLPSEHIYSMALRADPSLVDFASDKNVIIASPTLLMSLLRVVGMSWKQVELAQNAQEISERGIDLYNRILKFTDHMGKIGKNLQSAMKGYDEAVGSLQQKVLPAARKFKDLQASSTIKDLPEFEPVEETPRALQLTAEDEDEKKRA